MSRCWPAVLFVAAACNRQGEPPLAAQASNNWKASYTPAECEALTDKDAFVRRCHPGVDPNAEYLAEELGEENFVGKFNCMPYSPPQRLSGVWVIGLESSRFYPNASTYEETLGRSEKIWLETEEHVPADVKESGQGAGTRAYSIDFDGRRSLCEWRYGHFGMSPHEVVVERIVSLRALPQVRR